MKAQIVWIEGKKGISETFVPILRKKGYIVSVIIFTKSSLDQIMQSEPDLVIVHAPSLKISFKRICRSLKETLHDQPVVLLSNPDYTLDGVEAAEVLLLPLTSRKLVSRLKVHIPSILKTGPITLDMENFRVSCDGRESHLTPRLAKLLQKLMQHPGIVVERKKLFGSVWNTTYTDDTRTLDVHISWLRRSIEVDPTHPAFIVTVRGVGYRLDI